MAGSLSSALIVNYLRNHVQPVNMMVQDKIFETYVLNPNFELTTLSRYPTPASCPNSSNEFNTFHLRITAGAYVPTFNKLPVISWSRSELWLSDASMSAIFDSCRCRIYCGESRLSNSDLCI